MKLVEKLFDKDGGINYFLLQWTNHTFEYLVLHTSSIENRITDAFINGTLELVVQKVILL